MIPKQGDVPMLFLLNTTIVELPVPELHLRQRWRGMGCGDPASLRAQDAISFVTERLVDLHRSSRALDNETAQDLASLVIAKTGANSLTLKPTASGRFEPRLRDMPKLVLETYARGAANDQGSKPAGRIEA